LISTVIPANNEEGSIGDVVRRCEKYCDEVIVIDDGSTDRTLTRSREAGAVTYQNSSRTGIVASIAYGLRIARGEIIVTMDGDGQHDPAEMRALIQPILDGRADVVLGRRTAGIPFSERILAKLVNGRVQCVDVGTGYRAIRKDVAMKMQLWGVCLCGSFVLEAYKQGAKIMEVPISIRDRKNGKSHWPSPFSRGMTHAKQLLTVISHTIKLS
jgi:glycosyltransferase involved in cell wall biosynthesis